MKLFIYYLSFLLTLFQISFAQKYEYNIWGEHFDDTPPKNQKIVTQLYQVIHKEKPFSKSQKIHIYFYHQVGEGETADDIMNLYQIVCALFGEMEFYYYARF